MVQTRAVDDAPRAARKAWRFATARSPIVPLVVLLMASGFQVLGGYSHQDLSGHAWGADDAYITYRYVSNFLNGHGLVFNPGEYVEGYSTFLYVMVLAGLARVFGQAMYPLSVGLNLAFAGLALLCFFHQIQARFGRRNANIAVFLLALCPPLWLAVASGLETPLVLCLQLAAWLAADRVVVSPSRVTAYLLSAVLLLLTLARADGFVFVGIVLAYLAVNGRLKMALGCGLAVAVLSAPYVFWRLSYYNDFLPNTYYAKVAGTVYQRVRYASRQLLDLSVSVGLLPHLMVTAAGFAVTVRDFRLRRAGGGEVIPFEGIAAVGWVGYWLYIGGDSLNERFLLILFALGISALVRGLRHDLETRAGAFLLAMVLVLQLAPLGMDPRFRFTLEKYDRWKTLGRFLAEKHPGQSIAVDAAGKIPYFSGLYAIDMLGLADTFVAHQEAPFIAPGHSKADAGYVLRRRPDLIAAYIGSRQNLFWGLDRMRYESAGYKLRYLVNTAKLSARSFGWHDILDVGGLSDERIADLIGSVYGYAVLERVELPRLGGG
jgi:arabinofuranosyltransferase